MNDILAQIFGHWYTKFNVKTVYAGQFSSHSARPLLVYSVIDEKRHTTRAKFFSRKTVAGEEKIELLSPAVAKLQIEYVDTAANFDVARDFFRVFYDYLLTEEFNEYVKGLDAAMLVVSPIREMSTLIPSEFEATFSVDVELRYADIRVYDNVTGVIEIIDNVVFEEVL